MTRDFHSAPGLILDCAVTTPWVSPGARPYLKQASFCLPTTIWPVNSIHDPAKRDSRTWLRIAHFTPEQLGDHPSALLPYPRSLPWPQPSFLGLLGSKML